MASIKELREKQANIATLARSKFDEIKDDTPAERAAEIEREFDAMMADHDAIEGKIERMKRLEAVEAALDAPVAPAARGRDGGVAAGEPAGGPSYREAFHAYLRAQGNLGMMSG